MNHEITFTVSGMHCGACKVLIEEVLMELPGAQSCTLTHPGGQGVLCHSGCVSPVDITRAVGELGAEYRVDFWEG